MPYSDVNVTGLQWRVRTYFDVLNELLSRAGRAEPAVIAIDGRSGAGKTTLARGLAALEPRSVIIDTRDLALHSPFFDRAEMLVEHVLEPLRNGRTPITYRPEAWPRGRGGAIHVPADTSVAFVEGVGSARRELRPWLDAVVWVHVREDVGRRRIGTHGLDGTKFTQDWMQEEDAFLADQLTWDIADLLVAGALGQPAPNGRYGNVVTAPGPVQATAT